VNCDLILVEKKDETKQHNVTLFKNTLDQFKLIQGEDLETELLLLENVDFTFNRKKIVTKMVAHTEETL